MTNGKQVLYKEKLRELMEISEEERDPTFFDVEVTESLLDCVLEGKLVIGFKNGKVAFTKAPNKRESQKQ